jgi:hypothetical protein
LRLKLVFMESAKMVVETQVKFYRDGRGRAIGKLNCRPSSYCVCGSAGAGDRI